METSARWLAGEPSSASGFVARRKSREAAMKFTRLILAGAATLLITASSALAQAQNGQVTVVNRLNNTITVRPIQDGTVGANTEGEAQQYKVKDGLSLEDLHAGNHITYSATEQGGTRTITSFKKR
jgi:Cu/Ag efflux protein CusF